VLQAQGQNDLEGPRTPKVPTLRRCWLKVGGWKGALQRKAGDKQ
jgi:hypothetical protein